MNTIDLTLPLSDNAVASLKAGDQVTLSGSVYTARDQACRRLFEMIERDEPLPIDLVDQTIYFVGPTPTPTPTPTSSGRVIGSAGPTTSGRMNRFLPTLIKQGLRAFIGKGFISDDVKGALETRRGVYFGAIGGTGALLSHAIVDMKEIAFADLLSESIKQLQLHKFPAVVLHDTRGGDLYEKTYAKVKS